MKLSTRGRYAVMAMVDLSTKGGSVTATPLSLLAASQDLPLVYLEQLFVPLRRHGLVKSVRGQHGGYILAKPAGAISIAEIIHAVGEPMKATRCSPNEGCGPHGKKCMTHNLWERLGEHIQYYLDSVTLEDVCNNNLPVIPGGSLPTVSQGLRS